MIEEEDICGALETAKSVLGKVKTDYSLERWKPLVQRKNFPEMFVPVYLSKCLAGLTAVVLNSSSFSALSFSRKISSFELTDSSVFRDALDF